MAQPFSMHSPLMLRIPAWTDQAMASYQGHRKHQPQPLPSEKQSWKKGWNRVSMLDLEPAWVAVRSSQSCKHSINAGSFLLSLPPSFLSSVFPSLPQGSKTHSLEKVLDSLFTLGPEVLCSRMGDFTPGTCGHS